MKKNKYPFVMEDFQYKSKKEPEFIKKECKNIRNNNFIKI